MCAREPKLLEAGNAALMSRLLWLRARGPEGLDVGALVSSQPSLLLQPLAPDAPPPPPGSLSEEEERLLLEGSEGEESGGEEEEQRGEEERGEKEPVEELLRSWSAGLASDSRRPWAARFVALKGYVARHGDAAVGTRGGDDPALVRWAEKQRADFAGLVVGGGGGGGGGRSALRRRAPSPPAPPRPSFLEPYRRTLLEGVGFCFDAEEAEFGRMVAAAAAAGAGGEGSAGSGAATATARIGGGGAGGGGGAAGGGGGGASARGDELLLANWCSVQRIAKRSGALSAGRIAQLEAIGFDFDGADALS